jgi:hypothetical protein
VGERSSLDSRTCSHVSISLSDKTLQDLGGENFFFAVRRGLHVTVKINCPTSWSARSDLFGFAYSTLDVIYLLLYFPGASRRSSTRFDAASACTKALE